jgi:excinuclease ABC subunit A
MREPMQSVRVVGARQHNLKGLCCDIPRNRWVAITGPCGSGKSSLAFDTIYAEAERRYVESLSTQARQWLEQLPRPAVDAVTGLSPAVALEQHALSGSLRSTVGTITEIGDYLRVLFATIGISHCPRTGRALRAYTPEEIVDELLLLTDGTRLVLLAPLGRNLPGDLQTELEHMRRQGYARARIDEHYVELDGASGFDAAESHSVEVVVDRLVAGKSTRERLSDSVEHALMRGRGTLLVDTLDGLPPRALSERLVSWEEDIELPALEPSLFSFNSPKGACSECHGLGVLVKSASDTAVESRRAQRSPCPVCRGTRLRPETDLVRVGGHTFTTLSALPLEQLGATLSSIRAQLSAEEQVRSMPLLDAMVTRARFACQLGVGHLSTSRASSTLSAGEHQRVRLAAQLACDLTGVLYVLDEPSSGLHPGDGEALARALRALVDGGNTLLVVEHDLPLIRAADYVLELGPGAGDAGGRLVAAGTPNEVMANPASLTGPFLSGAKRLASPSPATLSHGAIEILGATAHNLNAVDVRFPMRALTAVTGVSGSGKSSLVLDTLCVLARDNAATGRELGDCREVHGLDRIGKVIEVEQSPIGRNARSNPATYTGMATELRQLFASLPEARARGYKAGRFSFNVKGGRCEKCQGDGVLRVEMHLLPDVYIPCDACRGRRFNRETLDIRYRGRNIAEVLALTVNEASELFVALPRIARLLEPLRQLGLGYLHLGQPAPSLSGGEAQRLKLATELARPAEGETLYLLDEPTSGLHPSDTELLLAALFALRDAGHTVVVIEHDPEFVACADWVIDLGPGAGARGGNVVAMGTPSEVAQSSVSVTGRFLRPLFDREARPETTSDNDATTVS